MDDALAFASEEAEKMEELAFAAAEGLCLSPAGPSVDRNPSGKRLAGQPRHPYRWRGFHFGLAPLWSQQAG